MTTRGVAELSPRDMSSVSALRGSGLSGLSRLKRGAGGADHRGVGDATSLLVTGASGFVGARLVRLALERGHSVTAVVRPGSRVVRLAPVLGELELVRVDINDAWALERVVAERRPRACVHLAAVGAVVRENDLGRVLQTNAVACAQLAAALGRAGCARLITAGSSSEYGSVEGPMDERQAARPDDPYGVAKLAGGLLAALSARCYGMESAHLRLFSVYGPGEDPRRLVPAVVDALLAGRPLDLTAGEQVRDFVYVDDVAEALLEAVHRPGLDGVTVNVGTGIQTSVRDLCTMVADLTGGHELLRFGARPYRPGERFNWRASTRLAEEILGWRAQTALRDGLSATVAHARACDIAEVPA